jgi:hypothetical protein
MHSFWTSRIRVLLKSSFSNPECFLYRLISKCEAQGLLIAAKGECCLWGSSLKPHGKYRRFFLFYRKRKSVPFSRTLLNVTSSKEVVGKLGDWIEVALGEAT